MVGQPVSEKGIAGQGRDHLARLFEDFLPELLTDASEVSRNIVVPPQWQAHAESSTAAKRSSTVPSENRLSASRSRTMASAPSRSSSSNWRTAACCCS